MAIGQYDIAMRSGCGQAMGVRLANDRIAEKAVRLRFVSRVPMLCECSDAGCRTIVMISLEDYFAIRRDADALITAPGHSTEKSELVSRYDDELRSA